MQIVIGLDDGRGSRQRGDDFKQDLPSLLRRNQQPIGFDSAGLIASRVGRVSFEPGDLKENILAFVGHIVKNRPPGAKGQYIKKIVLSTTMGPGLPVDQATLSF